MQENSHPLKVAFIGLGVMGFPMAGFLANAGHQVTVFNRTDSKADDWLKKYSGKKAASPAEAATDADFVFACVGDDNDLKHICIGENGAFSKMKSGSLFVDHTTTSANIAIKLAQAANKKDIGFIDAPVSGGQAGAEAGTLTVMVGAEEQDYPRVEPLIRCYSKMQKRMGDVGSGQLTKMINQVCIAGVVQGLSEALHLAKKSGLDPNAVVDVISKGAAQSWQMDNRASTMAKNEFNFGFAVDWMRKDLEIVLDQARSVGAHLPVTALVDQFYSQVQQNGGGRFDTSSLISLLERNND